MKKLLLSLGLIIAFAFYVVFSNSKSSSLNSQSNQASGNPDQQPQEQAKNTASIPSGKSAGEDDDDDDDDRFAGWVPKIVGTPVVPSSGGSTAVVPSGAYKNGSYTGNVIDAYFGNIQVKAIISGGKITDVQFLDYPKGSGTSLKISNNSMPVLKQEAIKIQNSNVDIVSGATQTSQAFQVALASALSLAK